STGTPLAGPLATNTMPPAMPGADSKPLAKLTPVHFAVHVWRPHPLASKACTTPTVLGSGLPCDATYRVSPRTAGAPSTNVSPVRNRHCGRPIAAPPPAVENTSTVPPAVPEYTWPLATVGVANAGPRSEAIHAGAHIAAPQPRASNATSQPWLLM